MASIDLGVARIPAWAGLVRVLQWLLIAAALLGVVWLAALAAMEYLQLPDLPVPEVDGFALPTLLLLGAVAAGLLLALLGRFLVRITARRRAAAADRQLRAAVHEVAEELVVRPVNDELLAHAAVLEGLARATR